MSWKEWPLGNLPNDWLDPHLEMVKAYGYNFDEPRDLVTAFENKIAEFTGAPYAVAVDSCTNAIFLALKYCGVCGPVTIPSRSYLSIPMTIKNSGFDIKFENYKWTGSYQLRPYPVWDCAVRFTKSMYVPESVQCLSFQIKKRLPIGKGGMILTDDAKAAEWFRQASFEGRHINSNRWDDKFEMCGYNMYATPEQAARGLILFHKLMDKYPSGVMPDIACQDDYPDLTKQEVFQ